MSPLPRSWPGVPDDTGGRAGDLGPLAAGPDGRASGTGTPRSTRPRAEPALAKLQLLITRKLDGLLQGDYSACCPARAPSRGSRANIGPATTYAGWTGR